jgi:hypothetical protein
MLLVALALSTAVTVIVTGLEFVLIAVSVTAVPAVTVAAVPPLTVTVVGSPDVHVTIRNALTSVPNVSVTVALSVVEFVPPSDSADDPGVPGVTTFECPNTTTVPEPDWPPLVAVIAADPSALSVAVTRPLAFTVAKPPLAGDHVTAAPGK